MNDDPLPETIMVEISSTLRIEEKSGGGGGGRCSNSSSSEEDEDQDGGGGGSGDPVSLSQSPVDPRAKYNRHSSRERLERRADAKKRWKILCIVRTADVESDETARQEKIQERVDEWMSGFMAKMKIQSEKEEEEEEQVSQ